MPPPLHPLPVNPTTGQQPAASLGGFRAGPPPASAAGGGGVSRDVLKGLQDVIFSDDEDDPDCVVCAEPLDLSDINFKPCQCGLQICQFCYNHLLSTDPRCPGCRRAYDANAVVFQPVDVEEVKRAKEKKTKRAKTIKQLDAMGRRHLLGVRIVMKNMVYVVGIKIPGQGEEAIAILRQHEYFGQYGKIAKIYLRERPHTSTQAQTSSSEDSSTPTGILIIYVRREDAARAIAALDGIPTPGGPAGQTIRASYGTTRYCEAFLRGIKCDTPNCPNLHEWGGEGDCFSRDDYTTALLRPQEYDAKQKQVVAAQSVPIAMKTGWPKPANEESTGSSPLPSSAGWGKGLLTSKPALRPIPAGTIGSSRPPQATTVLPLRSTTAFPPPTPSPAPLPTKADKRKPSAAAMARGKSNDSNTSSLAPSSSQPSPRKKSSLLPPLTAKTSRPPGLSAMTSVNGDSPHRPPLPMEEVESGERDDSSRDSETGPSSSSPAPQTPTRPTDIVPPLTDEPYQVHSPFPEPDIIAFPLSDPAFAFVLDNQAVPHTQFNPTPFNKVSIGLAELGILATDLPDLMISHPPGEGIWSTTFRPFDEDNVEPPAGPSRPVQLEQPDAPRSTSRFEFARANGLTGQNPFAGLRRSEDMGGNGWQQGTPAGFSALLGQAQGPDWDGSRSARSVGNGSVKGQRSEVREREEYESGTLLISHLVLFITIRTSKRAADGSASLSYVQSAGHPQRLFTPDSNSIPEDGPYGPSQLFSPPHQSQYGYAGQGSVQTHREFKRTLYLTPSRFLFL
ncbi:hypothetical protein M231_04101 [Tremella mesenterica]|uniref:RING-type domain-containing protein n=1 Tax=Tremella mesenterica TaxID=5217 RepID=A0A4Q1BLC9_TREME|nr:hypothetical protein M231_04101 [Tremella mesenterica]